MTRATAQAGSLGVPGAGADVPVEGSGGLVPDPDDPLPPALAVDGDLPLHQVHVAAPEAARVVADPGQFPRPDPGGGQHRHDRRVTALDERPALARLLQGQ
jgi:hypothetical protein